MRGTRAAIRPVLWPALLAAFALSLPADLNADQDPATDQVLRLVPYQGRLEKDGVAQTGTIKMIFRIYDGDAGPEVWMEAQNVPLHAGRFVVLLGQCRVTPGDTAVCPDGDQAAKAIDEVIRAADDLQLAVELDTADGIVPLNERKRLLPAPYGLWSTDATNLHVWNDLTVDGSSTVTGNQTVSGNATVSGALTVGSTTIHRLALTHETTATAALAYDEAVWGKDDTKNLAPTASAVCFLLRNYENHRATTYDDGARFECSVYHESGIWKLKALVGRGHHQETNISVECRAACLSWGS